MPECTNVVEIIQLMNFLLCDGQANAGWYSFRGISILNFASDFGSEFEINFLENIWKQLQRCENVKVVQYKLYRVHKLCNITNYPFDGSQFVKHKYLAKI